MTPAVSPKQLASSRAKVVYPYYAGFSREFVEALLDQEPFRTAGSILDPWNGAGTTSVAAAAAGKVAIGFDLNPVMVIASKARLFASEDSSEVSQAFEQIADRARAVSPVQCPDHPLLDYFGPVSTLAVRSFVDAIDTLLVPVPQDQPGAWVDRLTPLAAFFCVLLFRVVRRAGRQLKTSNPTWTRSAVRERRITLPLKGLIEEVGMEMHRFMHSSAVRSVAPFPNTTRIGVADSRNLPLGANSVDAVITSPPYCTRIDYAVSTKLELACLGVGGNGDFESLRRRLIGTTLTSSEPADLASSDPRVVDLLRSISGHQSKASSTYYLKTYVDYFSGMAQSVGELARVLKFGGAAALVVQDSYYKEIHIDLASIVTDLAGDRGLAMVARKNYAASQSLRGVHKHVRSEARRNAPVESLLIFEKVRR